MKKVTAVFVLILFLSNQNFAREMMRFPVLFVHYLEHTANNYDNHHNDSAHQNHGILNFLSDHYGRNDADNNEHSHEHLPFKHSSDGCPLNVIGFILCNQIETIQFIPDYHSNKPAFLTVQSLKSRFPRQIWQPPKIV